MIAVLFALMLAHAEPRPLSPDVADAVMRPVRISLTSVAPTSVSPSDPVSPTWTRLPDVENMMKAFPAEALRNGKGGGAVVACRLTAEGRASGCAVVEETPVGLGFGEAVLSLAPKFEFATRGPDGQSLVGGTFRIPLAWNAPQ
ncbi:MAG: TonB family protein [Caulobacter sp.]